MIAREIGALPAVLDRLLQVDRIASLPPLPAFDEAADPPGPRVPTSAAPPLTPTGTVPADPVTTTAVASTLPLGGTVTARVVEAPAAGHVVAEVGDLRIALAWPAASGVAPQPGQNVALRVLSHEPMLLFQRVERPLPATAGSTDPNVHWSSDAMRLQALAPAMTAPSSGSGIVRFDVPMLAIEIEALPPADGESANGRTPATGATHAADRPVPATTQAVPQTALQVASPAPAPVTDIAIDDVIVGHGTALVNGVEATLVPHLVENIVPTALPFAPLVLQGPAWDGQAMELVVRRERDDAQFDNPVLDHWCGEVTIDLPHLGRVAGHLSFSMQGLRVRIEGDDEQGVTTMSAASSELAAALAHADLRVAGLTVAGRSADLTRTDFGAGYERGYGGRHG